MTMKRKDWIELVSSLLFFLLIAVMQWLFARQFSFLYLWMILEFILITIMWAGAKKKRKDVVLVTALLLLFLIAEVIQWRDSRQFNWPYLWTTLEIILIIIMWDKFPLLRKLVGEDDSTTITKRPRWILRLNLCLWILLFLPLSLYLLTAGPNAGQFSIIAVAPVLGGLVLTTASIKEWPSEKRSRLIRIAQKFISATVLFILFIPFIFLIDLLNGIDPNSFQWNDVAAWFRGIYFWLAAPCFFIGEALFLFGLTDLVYALVDLNSADNNRGDINKNTIEIPESKKVHSRGVNQLIQDPNKLAAPKKPKSNNSR